VTLVRKPDQGLEQTQELLIRREYQSHSQKCDALADSIRLICESALETAGIPFHSVKSRIKSLSSTLEKIVRKRYKPILKSVKDVVGIRVILLYPDDIDATVKLLEREFRILERVDKRPNRNSQQFGYSSVHLVCTLERTARSRLAEYTRLIDIPFEVQIRTILQEAWAEIEHRLVYKTEVEAPNEIKRRIVRISGLLEMADDEFQNIYRDRAAYIEKLRSADLGDARDEPLNIDTLSEIIRRRYGWAEGWEKIGDNQNKAIVYLADLLNDMQMLGVTTVRQLMAIIDKWYDKVFEYSARAQLIASGKVQSKGPEDVGFSHTPEDGSTEWCNRTGQYFFPIGHLRYILRREFPEYNKMQK
jgi:putative GTP pyrophosphokinase